MLKERLAALIILTEVIATAMQCIMVYDVTILFCHRSEQSGSYSLFPDFLEALEVSKLCTEEIENPQGQGVNFRNLSDISPYTTSNGRPPIFMALKINFLLKCGLQNTE